MPKKNSQACNKDLYNCLLSESQFFLLPFKNSIHLPNNKNIFLTK